MEQKAILPKHHVLLDLEGSRRDVLTSLGKPLVQNHIVDDLERFLDDIEERERQITMQVSPVVALPHARSNAVRRLGLTVGISKTGVSYTDSGEPVCRLLFLIAIPAFAPTAHLPLLQHLAAFAHDDARVGKLIESTTPARAASQLTRFNRP